MDGCSPELHHRPHFLSLGAVAALVLLGAAESRSAGTAPHGIVTDAQLDAASAYALSQDAIGRHVGNHAFIDRAGREVSLTDLLGVPVVFSLIYTSCYHTCTVATRQLAQVVDIGREALGDDTFTVVTVGFDTSADTPERMASYARQQGVTDPGWRFLSASPETIAELTKELGFVYFPSPKGFEHTVQVTLLDADGMVYRQVYGEQFPPPNLVEPLKELVFGTGAKSPTLSGWVNGLKLFCTVYDPTSGRYRFDYSVLVAAFVGVLCLGAVAIFLVQAFRQHGGGRHAS